MSGIISVNIGNELRSLKFGTNSTARYCEVRGCTLNDYIEDMNLTDMRGDEVRDLIYSGLWAFDITSGKQIDYTRYDVGNWIDDSEQKEINKIFTSLVESNTPKVKAKETEGTKKK